MNKNIDTIEDIIKLARLVDGNTSSEDIEKAIKKLEQAKRQAELREREEKLKKEKEEKERLEREREEERQRHIQEVTCMDLPVNWDNFYDADESTRGVHADSIGDGLIMCLSNLGKVDIEYIASITGADYKTVISTLKGSIYQNPETWEECFYKGWETAEEYLSGNVMRKLKAAKKADEEYAGYFKDNIVAIEKVLPTPVKLDDIYITLGSPWIPSDIIDEFIIRMFWDSSDVRRYDIHPDSVNYKPYKVIHDEMTGTWEIPFKSRYKYVWNACSIYGTNKMNGIHILEHTLNMKTVSVTEEITLPNSKTKKRVVNKKETIAALEKQKQLIKDFRVWLWHDEARVKRLEKIFEEKYGCVRKRNYDGSFLEFPNMDKSIELYPYQKNAVARIIFSGNTLLAHDVGAGKTFVMVAAGQELRRMGLSKKNMYVVPNNIVGQWKNIFLSMYPGANVLCVEPKTFKPNKRKEILESIRDEEYDGIIIAYSCFELIPLSKEFYLDNLRKDIKLVEEVINKSNKATSRLKKKKDVLSKALGELAVAAYDMYDGVYFDELGITRLFVDEAHNFKNIPIETKINKVLGISNSKSKKCKDMLDKVHLVQSENDGKGVVFATGTPITNSITDIYVMQQFLQSGELGLLDLQSFDGWIGMFAEKVTEFEVDIDTSQFRLATRFAKFHNLPELTTLLAAVADFHSVDQSSEIPEFDGYKDALISKTVELESYLKAISNRAEDVRHGYVSRTDDNMLKITTDGRKAALDIRLVEPQTPFSYQSKVARCAENVADIYHKNSTKKSTQVIFCDTSTPKDGFNLYDELKDRLIGLLVPENQIAFIHDADTDKERSRLFAALRKGDVRVLIGSTFKLGLGVNIQDKLIALHHLDVPWRPADMVQREGRILRQGNTNQKVEIYRYITEGSFDAYSWQLLETKQRFISAMLSGSITERSGSDIEDTILDYAEVKALAVGNPLIKQRVEVANELSRYLMLQRKAVDNKLAMEKQLLELPSKIKQQEVYIDNCKKDLNTYRLSCKGAEDNKTSGKKQMDKAEAEYRKKVRTQLTNALDKYILKEKEKLLMTYRGFDIILPNNMLAEKPYVWIQGSGKYYVEMGDTEVGNLIRIDNFIESLDIHLVKLRKQHTEMITRKKEIESSLAKDENYYVQINLCKKKLEEIDDKLGVKKDGRH